MTTLEDGFWEQAIGEAAGGRKPPAQTDVILTRLQIPDLGPPPVEEKPKGRLLRLRHLFEAAAAVAALLAIGVLTGLIPLGGGNAGNGAGGGEDGPDTPPMQVAAAPDSEFRQEENELELEHGWLLVTTGAPDVTCEGSRLTKVDGRVLVHAGNAPTGKQVDAVEGWLAANKLETEMINEAKRWFQAAGMAALVLTGSAMLDGQRIEAQDETTHASPQWRAVESVMDIEKLPSDAQWVRGERLDGNYLEFLSAHTAVKGIAFTFGDSMRPVNLKQLASMPNLEYLEIRGAVWAVDPDYSPLTEMKALKQLYIDYVPSIQDEDGKAVAIASDSTERYHILSSLRTLSDRGVDIHLGKLAGLNDEQLAKIVASLPGLTSLTLRGNRSVSSTSMKLLAESSKITSLNLYQCSSVEDLGLAYLARANKLTALTLGPAPTAAELYQVAKMTNLQELTLVLDLDRYMDVVKDHVGELKTLTNLKRLEVLWQYNPMARFEGKGYEQVDAVSDLAKACPALTELNAYATLPPRDVARLIDSLQGTSLKRLGIGFRPSETARPAEPEKVVEDLKDIKPLSGVDDLEIRLYSLKSGDALSSGLDTLAAKFPDLKRLELTIDWYRSSSLRDGVPEFEKRVEAFRKAHPDLKVTFEMVEE